MQPRAVARVGCAVLWTLREVTLRKRLGVPVSRPQGGALPSVSGVEFAKQAARIADENHAEDVVILDLRGISSVADFFVIGTGTSDRQMRAVIDHIEEYGYGVGQKPFGVSGYDSSTWVLADYVDVVVHMFDADRRRFYDLELLWGDAPRVDWRHEAPALVR